ncbi:hypothetical protein SAMN04487969_101364 [Paenibacillus algorifonticola]|uniref:Lipoprotein n=1 Tax=Paenibacillus algorifonticola TaxID=684063 RepID=A0A1I1Y8H0_9BACL|nr:hypothetical protein [Paenibacillus algorifonticola]SFE15632.1 hypothetical protein SAMN04487969_101364 [Paenibacillus algorifonticola]
MKKRKTFYKKISYGLLIAVAIGVLSGCSSKEATTAAPSPSATIEASAAASPSDTATASPTAEPEKDLNASEQLTLGYINSYYNEADVEARKKFAQEHMHPDVQSVFIFAASAVIDEKDHFLNPKVVETVDYEKDGAKGSLTLVKGDGDKEFIGLIIEDKFSFGFISTATSDDMKAAFEGVRAQFK